MRFIDTNIILRFVVEPTTPYERARMQECISLFARVREGLEQVQTCEAVIAEVAYVLASRRNYGMSHADAATKIRPIVELRGLHIDHKNAILLAIDLYEDRPYLDFEDALLIAHMERQGEGEIYSYDADFDRVPGVQRVTP